MVMVMVMESYKRSYQFYTNLIREGDNGLFGIVNSRHPTQFKVNKETGLYYKKLYIDQLTNYKTKQISPPPDDNTCHNCKSHFLSNRPTINHQNDLRIGGELEEYFQEFLNRNFKKWKLPISCERADKFQLNMPDFMIINKETNEAIFYFEFKCIFKPFIKVNTKINGAYCYSHSMTLDCDNKLIKQKKLIEEKEISNKTAYVYWYDIPCVKGVFWQLSEDVFTFQKAAQTYQRNKQAGDFNSGNRVGHIDKLYLPLHSMNNFNSLINKILSLIETA